MGCVKIAGTVYIQYPNGIVRGGLHVGVDVGINAHYCPLLLCAHR